jgi:hypothetical protein
MRMPRVILISMGAVALSTAITNAQQLAPEAKFSITYTSLNASPVKPIAISKDQDMTVSSAVMAAVNDGPPGRTRWDPEPNRG